MKVLLYSDVHISAKESIVTKYGFKYTVRLEHLINSLNWAFRTAERLGCGATICLGDFMHKAQCTDMELTALLDINWSNMPNYFLCGNHESSVADLRYSTVNAIAQTTNNTVISDVSKITLDSADFYFIPYITESDRMPLSEYLTDYDANKPNYIISHNDIADICLGGFKTITGFSITDIETLPNSTFLNGHLHNSGWVGKNALNIGSISGHNFTNDSYAYSYGVWILDTVTGSLDFVENPYAFNFYKIEICTESDLDKLKLLKNNAVVSIKCEEKLVVKLREFLVDLPNILESRIIVIKNYGEPEEDQVLDLTVDHLARFIECCKANIESTPLLDDEIAQVCR